MKNAGQIEKYLEVLAGKLADQGDGQQYHILISGGAWMLLQRERRVTHDIDFALIEYPGRLKPGKVVRVVVQRGGEIATRKGGTVFSDAVEAVAADMGLPVDWLNDESAAYLYDSAPDADAYLWRVFADVLFVYLPTDEYMLALKIAAYRRKDRVDCLVLLHRLGITTREETQDILDTFLSEQEQRIWDVDQKLKRLFR